MNRFAAEAIYFFIVQNAPAYIWTKKPENRK